MTHFEEAREIWLRFVPRSGQSETVQGELLRSVEKLRDQAVRNGNANWDEGFEILLGYLDKHLMDTAVFSPEILADTGSTLARFRDIENPVVGDALYDQLSDRVVEHYRHYGSKPNIANPRLLR